MRLALAQLAASADRDANLEKVLSSMEEAASRGADAIVFPELVVDRFFPRRPGDEAARELAEPLPGEMTEAVRKKALDCSLVTVFNFYEQGRDDERFDSSPVFDADGSLLGVTRMVHITDYEHFHEKDYYTPGDLGAPVYKTGAGRIGVAICYDRHFPEYMRALGAGGAELVVIPQAGTVGEWPEGLYEAEVRVAAFQNGYFAALCNRVGREGEMEFAGESFAVDPEGRVLERGASGKEDLVLVELDLEQCKSSTAQRLFWRDRRPELYGRWLGS